MGSADRWPNLIGKTWANKTTPEMTDAEVNDARATFEAVGRIDYESEWLRRHGLPENYGD
ncbi:MULTISPECIES: hypothetical protein [unclassified Streptomyces]|uniref:hypothetical protein n=1 Tax=unclassified Streptomyces TaxID=2593676 RepID=UPI000804C059|nr:MULTISPECIES: hypothetical protein [unclassified Streptomyces]MYR75199.1 hypothetical protein [Streptomyces sp. SID4925]SBU98165.1 hypothetical protein YUMDRAFT_06078 [Streptomyces sp. OspMP-M45]